MSLPVFTPGRGHRWADPADYAGSLAMLIDPAGSGRGILFVPAHAAQPADVTAMALHARGICTATINEGTAMRLGLHVQGGSPRAGDEPYQVNSVEAAACDETGISAAERATTMRALANPDAVAEDLTTPGHVMVLVARNILRDGSTPAELANALISANRIARFAAWADILDDEGNIGDAAWCKELAERLGLPCFNGDDVRGYAREKLAAWDQVVRFSAEHFDSPQNG